MALVAIAALAVIVFTAVGLYGLRDARIRTANDAGGGGRPADAPALPGSATPSSPQPPEETQLRQAVVRAPSDAAAHHALGAYLASHDRAAEALWEFSVARNRGRRDPTLWLQDAGALRLLGLPEVAVARLREGQREHPENTTMTLALVESLLTVARPEEAVAILRAARGLTDTTEGLLLLGRARFALGDAAGARAALLKARDRGERTAECDHLLGRMARALKQHNEARARLGAAALASPGDAEAQYDAGVAWSEGPGSDEREALRFFNAALRANPRHGAALFQIGRLSDESRGRWEHAARVYGTALRRDPTLAEAELGLVRILGPLGMPAEVAYHQAQYLRLKSRPDEAIPFYRRWGELRSERWESPMRVAECLIEMNRDREAAGVLAAGLKRHPGNNTLLLLLAQLYARTFAPQEAARVADEWSRSDPASGRPEWLRGRLALTAQDNGGAIRWFEAARTKSPTDPIFQLALADALAREPTPDRLRQARDLLDAAVARDSRSPEYPHQLGVVLQALNEPDAARAAFFRALDLGARRAEVHNGLVQAAGRLNAPGPARDFADLARHLLDSQRAEQTAFRRLWQKPSDLTTRLAVARALLDRGEIARAADHLEVAARARQPEAVTLLQRVQRLLVVTL